MLVLHSSSRNRTVSFISSVGRPPACPPGRGCPGRHDPWKHRLVPSESQSLSASSTAPVPKVHHWKGLHQPVESCLVVRASTSGRTLACLALRPSSALLTHGPRTQAKAMMVWSCSARLLQSPPAHTRTPASQPSVYSSIYIVQHNYLRYLFAKVLTHPRYGVPRRHLGRPTACALVRSIHMARVGRPLPRPPGQA